MTIEKNLTPSEAQALANKTGVPVLTLDGRRYRPVERLAQQHLDYMDSPEFRQIVDRLFAQTATDADRLKFIETELREALDSLEPSAPDNGRAKDGWHASACVLRAWSVVLRLMEAKP